MSPRLAIFGRSSSRACHISLLCHISPFVQNRSLSWNCYDADLNFVNPSPPKRRSAQASSQKLSSPSPRTRRLQPEPTTGSDKGLDAAALATTAEGLATAAVNRGSGDSTAAR